MGGFRLGAWCAVWACLIFALSESADAQHFGRNKVRYRTFDFQILKTEHFDVYFYTGEREGVEIAARLAERWYTRLSNLFGHTLSGRQPLILYASHSHFEQTNAIDGDLDDGTAGVTEPFRRRIILPLAESLADTDHVLGHELVHAFQFDMATGLLGSGGEIALARLPLWFVEGMAEYASRGPVNSAAALRLRDAVRRHELPSILDLGKPTYFPYHWGHAWFAYIADRYGDRVVPRLLSAAQSSGSVDYAIRTVLGVGIDEVTRNWHDALRSLTAPALAAAQPLDGMRRVVSGRSLGAELNVGPVLSPDGRAVAFFSARNFFTTDLYIADVETGKVRRTLTRTATSDRYSTLQFIRSAGAWAPSGERLAMAAMISGRPALVLFNTRTGKHERDILIGDLDEILSPAWSPDSQAIVMSGRRGGVTDLFVYDLRTGNLEQLTRDAYSELHPSWSLDGTKIAFATDRFSTDLQVLGIGELQLALFDVATRQVEELTGIGTGKHINPQWSPDGQGLFFIAEPDGVPNVYRLSLRDRKIEQITFLGTGVSGLTESSPALSVSSRAARVAFSVYEDERYQIHIGSTAIGASPPQRLFANAARLATGTSSEGVIASLLENPSQGLPVAPQYETEAYKPKLSVEGFGQPTAGIGTSRFGTTIAGGGAVVFSDILGDHRVGAAVQVDSGWTEHFSFNDVAFEAAYFNQKRRWSWGFVGGQIPYLGGGYQTTEPASDASVAINRRVVYRQIQRSASGVLSYPFDRARRVELHGGLAHTSFDQVVSSIAYSPQTGRPVSDPVETHETLSGLTLATSAVAIVFDTARFGPTSPVQGQRYRIQISPAVGSTRFVGLLADYRKYTMPLPFYTIAVRVLHYGRYGTGSEDPRLYPVYINDPSLVRGYDYANYMADCAPVDMYGCRPEGQFVGSRMLVGNVEVRFPLLRPFGVSRHMYGPLPVEAAVFLDSGVAWHRDDLPSFLGGTRSGVSSAGLAFRLPLGIAVAEFNVARALQRPVDPWIFGFQLSPGW